MSTQHTRLVRYGVWIFTEGGSPEDIAIAKTDYGNGVSEARENARRLVAAWNACEGISTETLELVPRFTEAGIKTVQSVEAEVAALKAQRDELVEALKLIAASDAADAVLRPQRAVLIAAVAIARVTAPAVEGGA